MDYEGTAIAPSFGTGVDGDRYDAHELAQLADDLVDQIGAARRHYADLRAAIDDSGGAAEPAAYAAGREGQDVDSDESLAGYHRTPEEEAEIVALGMALNGGSRHEAHLHIVETFGIYDTDEILDRTFGAHVANAGARRRRFARLRRG